MTTELATLIKSGLYRYFDQIDCRTFLSAVVLENPGKIVSCSASAGYANRIVGQTATSALPKALSQVGIA